MNKINPTIGFEFEDNYKEAYNKLFDFIKAFDDLTPSQQEQMLNEVANATGNIALLDILKYMSTGGKC